MFALFAASNKFFLLPPKKKKKKKKEFEDLWIQNSRFLFCLYLRQQLFLKSSSSLSYSVAFNFVFIETIYFHSYEELKPHNYDNKYSWHTEAKNIYNRLLKHKSNSLLLS